MSLCVDRRQFLSGSLAAATLASWTTGCATGASPDEPSSRVTVGVMGLNQGKKLAHGFAAQPNVRVKFLCDVDAERLAECRQSLSSKGREAPQAVEDFRRILDDPEVDALVCAAPNHWHAAATVLACAAGKHVYVEKPCSHTPAEGELMIEAARKHNRIVQVGLNRRSSGVVREAIGKLRDGAIGTVYSARATYNNHRPSIGMGQPCAVPLHLNYDLWQGPAPREPFLDNRIHYNWHWFWHWGNGELGNNGVHALDVCRWGLGVDSPTYVTASGGRYRFDDSQQTPDTSTATFTFAEGKEITWQGYSCSRHRLGRGFVTFFGEGGALELSFAAGYTLYDENDHVVQETADDWKALGVDEHISDFVAAIRNGDDRALHCDIAEGHRSTMLAHLGNIAFRSRRALHCDPTSGLVLNDAEAQKLWQREYEPGWEPKV